jgi:putative membrane protein
MSTGVVLFVAFLALYLYKVALKGPNTFQGSGLAEIAYFGILGVHMVLAIVCIPLLYYVLLLAMTRPMHELSATAHPRVGKVAAPLWLISFVLGIVVYVMLYVVY